MKIHGIRFISIVLLVVTITAFRLIPAMGDTDVAEISKIEIEEFRVKETEQIWRYEFAETAGYVQLKPVREWDFLEPGDVIQTLEDVFVRLEFTTIDYLFLGKGAVGYAQCQSEQGEQVCAAARFEGLQTGNEFCYLKNSWYLDYGSAFVNSDNICLHDNTVEVEPGGTQFYMSSTRAKTTIVVLDGHVRVRAYNDPQRRIFTYPEGAHIEIGAADTQPHLRGQVQPDTLANINHWVRRGTIVIRMPVPNEQLFEPSMRVSGTVSDPDVHTVEIVIEKTPIQTVAVRNQTFDAIIPSPTGTRKSLTVQATLADRTTVSDTVTVFPQFAQPPIISSTGTTDSTIDSGQSITFSWRTQYADEVVLNNKAMALSGNYTERPARTTTYRLTARNADGEDTRTFTVTVKPSSITVPDVRNLSENDAIRRLTGAGLQRKIAHKPSNRIDVVIQQDPPPGSFVSQGAVVTVYVGEVPDEILCMSETDAKNRLINIYQFSPNQIQVDPVEVINACVCGNFIVSCAGEVISYNYDSRRNILVLTVYDYSLE